MSGAPLTPGVTVPSSTPYAVPARLTTRSTSPSRSRSPAASPVSVIATVSLDSKPERMLRSTVTLPVNSMTSGAVPTFRLAPVTMIRK